MINKKVSMRQQKFMTLRNWNKLIEAQSLNELRIKYKVRKIFICDFEKIYFWDESSLQTCPVNYFYR